MCACGRFPKATFWHCCSFGEEDADCKEYDFWHSGSNILARGRVLVS